MEIKTERLLLREFLPTDISNLQEILGDAETMEFLEPPYDLEKTTRFLNCFCIDRHGALAVVYGEKVVGYLLFHPLEDGVYEMGWIFHRAYWRRGFAYEACAALIACAFAEKNTHKICAETIDGYKSLGLMKKLGMKLEGVQRCHTRDNRGNWTDLYLCGLLREDLPERQK